MSATVIVGQVRTQDPTQPAAEAIGWRDGRLVAVGRRQEVLAATPGAEVLEVRGAVLPGFIDGHHHIAIAALYDGTARLVPPAVTDIASLQAALAAAARSSKLVFDGAPGCSMCLSSSPSCARSGRASAGARSTTSAPPSRSRRAMAATSAPG